MKFMTNAKTAETNDRKAILSTLWIFVMFNYLYGDLAMMIFHPAAYQRIVAGMSEGIGLEPQCLWKS